jgi:hypothetical protein
MTSHITRKPHAEESRDCFREDGIVYYSHLMWLNAAGLWETARRPMFVTGGVTAPGSGCLSCGIHHLATTDKLWFLHLTPLWFNSDQQIPHYWKEFQWRGKEKYWETHKDLHTKSLLEDMELNQGIYSKFKLYCPKRTYVGLCVCLLGGSLNVHA